MATVGSDTFTEASDTDLASHTPDVGAGWTLEQAGWATVNAASDELRADADVTTGRDYCVKGDNIGDDDMDVTCGLKRTTFSTQTTRFHGIAGRTPSTPGQDGYNAMIRLDAGSLCDWELEKEVAGAVTSLGTWNGDQTAGVYYTTKLEIRTAAKKVYVAGVERISSSDDSLTGNNFCGISGFLNTSASAFRWDNFLSESVAVAGIVRERLLGGGVRVAA